MFDSLFSTGINTALVFLMAGVALACGVVAAFIMSLKMRSSKGFFVTVALMPAIVSLAFCFLNVMIKTDTTAAISSVAAVAIGLGLIRFRSAQGKAEEMIALFLSVALGAVCGLGYLAYAAIFAVAVPLIYVGLMSLNVFKNKRLAAERVLRITIPENLDYSGVFDETFKHYLKECEPVGVKTVGMGSMFRLSYRIVMKDQREEKEMIDELRVKNGNLEISVIPYVDDPREL